MAEEYIPYRKLPAENVAEMSQLLIQETQFRDNNNLTWGDRKRVFSGSSVVGDEYYLQYQLWAGLSWILELRFIK